MLVYWYVAVSSLLSQAEFERLDTDRSGKLTLKEVQANGK